MPHQASDLELVETAVHTAVSELPDDAHEDDILDCVYGMVGHRVFTTVEKEGWEAQGEPLVRGLIRRYK